MHFARKLSERNANEITTTLLPRLVFSRKNEGNCDKTTLNDGFKPTCRKRTPNHTAGGRKKLSKLLDRGSEYHQNDNTLTVSLQRPEMKICALKRQ